MRDADSTTNILFNAVRPPMLTFNKARKYINVNLMCTKGTLKSMYKSFYQSPRDFFLSIQL